MNKTTHYWEPLAAENTPCDPAMDGSGLRFTPMEYDENLCPMAILVIDNQGRSLTYVPVQHQGRPVKSGHFFHLNDVDYEMDVARDHAEMEALHGRR